MRHLNKDHNDLKNNLKVASQLNIDYQKDVSKLKSLISASRDTAGAERHPGYGLVWRKSASTCRPGSPETKTAKQTLMSEMLTMERQMELRVR